MWINMLSASNDTFISFFPNIYLLYLFFLPYCTEWNPQYNVELEWWQWAFFPFPQFYKGKLSVFCPSLWYLALAFYQCRIIGPSSFPASAPGKDGFGFSSLYLALYLFLELVDRIFAGLPPAADCCCFLPGAGPMVGARRVPLLPSGTDGFASTPLSVQVTWLPLPGTIGWGVSWPFFNNLMVLLHIRESPGKCIGFCCLFQQRGPSLVLLSKALLQSFMSTHGKKFMSECGSSCVWGSEGF